MVFDGCYQLYQPGSLYPAFCLRGNHGGSSGDVGRSGFRRQNSSTLPFRKAEHREDFGTADFTGIGNPIGQVAVGALGGWAAEKILHGGSCVVDSAIGIDPRIGFLALGRCLFFKTMKGAVDFDLQEAVLLEFFLIASFGKKGLSVPVRACELLARDRSGEFAQTLGEKLPALDAGVFVAVEAGALIGLHGIGEGAHAL